MDAVRWGIIGTAAIALDKVIPSMLRAEGVNVVAIASRNADKARAAANRFGIEHSYGTYEAILADPAIEAVYIPLPNHLHVEWTIRAAEAGKHVLCEKPLALNVEKLNSLIACRDSTGRLIQEAVMIRAHPQWDEVCRIVSSGEIGEVHAVNGVFTEVNLDPKSIVNDAAIGGGALYDLGVYPITAARVVFGTEPERVFAASAFDPAFGVDRLTSAILLFSGGRHASMAVSTQLALRHHVVVFGTLKSLSLSNPFNPTPNDQCRIVLSDGSTLEAAAAETRNIAPADQYCLQAERFSTAVRSGGSVPIELEWSLGTMKILDAIRRSVESGAPEPV
ncbi:Gfo/Idh/MocA family protein [Rhizobium laguerreae]|uniref:Gfo/Idh/MocA family oxidoreductase n=1 Tax=Rhizobium laguerreae TaxID=1076926 RepID=A0A7Y2W8P9_9HYPH|nr:Gfo/Idh/MocA family oxidoreductase [Rhizobium laguerreae]NNH67745.1 Gfo/Idh/MocA family oxidoreductase [Rhizobium laguerreae]